MLPLGREMTMMTAIVLAQSSRPDPRLRDQYAYDRTIMGNPDMSHERHDFHTRCLGHWTCHCVFMHIPLPPVILPSCSRLLNSEFGTLGGD